MGNNVISFIATDLNLFALAMVIAFGILVMWNLRKRRVRELEEEEQNKDGGN